MAKRDHIFDVQLFGERTNVLCRRSLAAQQALDLLAASLHHVRRSISSNPPVRPLTFLLLFSIGIITLIDAVCLFIWLPDSPTTARWLTKRQRVVAVRRMQRNSTGIENKVFKMSQAKEALLDVKTWLYFIIQILINIPNGGLVTVSTNIVISVIGDSRANPSLTSVQLGRRLQSRFQRKADDSPCHPDRYHILDRSVDLHAPRRQA